MGARLLGAVQVRRWGHAVGLVALMPWLRLLLLLLLLLVWMPFERGQTVWARRVGHV
jgi:hypothetical protein